MQLAQGPIGQLNSKYKKVNIIGAGVSGLMMGYHLKKKGFEVKIFEKQNKVGGKIGTIATSYGPAETAANAIFTNDDVLELMDDLSLEYYSAPSTLKKYVWRNGKPQSPPFKLFELIRIILGAFKRIDKSDLSKKTIFDFFSPMMGKFFAAEVMSAALGGIYAETTKIIHFQSLFKHPFKSKTYFGFFRELMKMRKSRSSSKAKSISFEGGMVTFIDKLKENLKESIVTNHEASLTSGNTIICTEASDASIILGSTHPRLSKLLAKIKYNSMYTSTVFTDKEIDFLSDGFGVVIPPCENFINLGILSNRSIFPNRTYNDEHFSYTFMTKTKDDLGDIIPKELDRITTQGFSKHITHIESTRWPKAIPIYDLNRFETIMQIRSEMNNYENGLVLFGNYIDGISIREMVSMAKNFANQYN